MMKKAVSLTLVTFALAFAVVVAVTTVDNGTVSAAGDPVAIYKAKCAGCHSEDGKGKESIGTPNFTDAKWQAGHSNAVLTAAINNGKGTMPGYKSSISAADVKALVAHIRSFGPKAAPAKKK